MSKVIVAYVAECTPSFAKLAPESMFQWTANDKTFVGMKISDEDHFNFSTLDFVNVAKSFETYKNITSKLSNNEKWMKEFNELDPVLMAFAE